MKRFAAVAAATAVKVTGRGLLVAGPNWRTIFSVVRCAKLQAPNTYASGSSRCQRAIHLVRFT